MKRPEVDRMRALLVEAITTLCRSGLQYNANLKVEGLIGITLDEADIILVNLNKTFGSRFGDHPSPEKNPRDEDEPFSEEDEFYDRESPEPPSPRERSFRDYPKKRPSTTTVPRELKKSRESPPRDYSDNDSRVSQHSQIAGSHQLASPENEAMKSRLVEPEPQPTIPCASSAESALTVPSRTIPSSTISSQSDQISNQDSRTMKLSSGDMESDAPVVKIEIESDPEIEEVKIEPTAVQSCSRVPPLPYQTQISPAADTSVHNTFPQDFPQSIPSLSASDLQGELFASQLPPEFAAAAQSDTGAIPVQMFSGALAQPQQMPGPSGMTGPPVGPPFIPGDPNAPRLVQPGTSGQKVKQMRADPNPGNLNPAAMSGMLTCPKADPPPKVKRAKKTGGAIYLCKYCGKVYASRNGKNKHEKTHEGQYGSVCPICNKGFMNQLTLEAHMNTHQAIPIHECRKCGQDFENIFHRDIHEQSCPVKIEPQ